LAKDTKQRILKAALSNFNELGYFNVRLQHIADTANMSVGNMAYHFQQKVELFNILYKEWRKQHDFLLGDIHLTPIFENFDTFLQQIYQLQQQYRFLYIDQLELVRMSPEVQSSYQEYFQNQQEQLDILLALYQARGVLDWKKQNPQLIALKIRRIIDNWLRLQLMEGKTTTSLPKFQAHVWSELQPYFTESGQVEFTERNYSSSLSNAD